MLDRRSALHVIAAIFGMQSAKVTPRATCALPTTLTLDLGSGNCTIKSIRVQQGAVWADISVPELLSALGAKTQ